MTLLKDQAVQTALTGDWNAAISLNLELLKENPDDIEALNRLAFAYNVIGKTKEAKTTYQKVLEIDRQNIIALKNIKRLSNAKNTPHEANYSPLLGTTGNTAFLEESGKTKVVDLINIAESKITAQLIAGERIQLRVKRSKIFILDMKQQYVGMLPDNIGKRLIRFIDSGNEYEAYIKSTEGNHRISIFIKETKRATSLRNVPSFILSDKGHNEFEKNISTFNKQQNKAVENKLQDDIDEDESE